MWPVSGPGHPHRGPISGGSKREGCWRQIEAPSSLNCSEQLLGMQPQFLRVKTWDTEGRAGECACVWSGGTHWGHFPRTLQAPAHRNRGRSLAENRRRCVHAGGKCASSCVDLGYTNQFCVPEVTSVFFSSCDSLVGDSLEFNQANRGS